MGRPRLLTAASAIVWLCFEWNAATGQTQPVAPVAPIPVAQLRGLDAGTPMINKYYDDTLMHQQWWIDVELLQTPIYISQFGGKYVLHGCRLPIGHPPRFYAVLPGTNPFSSANPFNLWADITEIEDQSNAAYINFHLKQLNRSRIKFLHDMTVMTGITHDKLETGSATTYYKFPDGGMELTAMLNKRFFNGISNVDLRRLNLLFNFDVQAGLFASLSTIRANMAMPQKKSPQDSIYISTTWDGYWWQEKRFFVPGWGWLAGANAGIGGMLSHKNKWLRHCGLALSARVRAEGLYTAPEVIVSNETGYSKLHVANYGVFFAGPILCLKYVQF
ncbi:MAG TPA: hypothetical protein VL978_10485 [Puia sp.]|nr:hypothetical protein [Puia sp.]